MVVPFRHHIFVDILSFNQFFVPVEFSEQLKYIKENDNYCVCFRIEINISGAFCHTISTNYKNVQKKIVFGQSAPKTSTGSPMPQSSKNWFRLL